MYLLQNAPPTKNVPFLYCTFLTIYLCHNVPFSQRRYLSHNAPFYSVSMIINQSIFLLNKKERQAEVEKMTYVMCLFFLCLVELQNGSGNQLCYTNQKVKCTLICGMHRYNEHRTNNSGSTLWRCVSRQDCLTSTATMLNN